jgi:hypothetical protein
MRAELVSFQRRRLRCQAGAKDYGNIDTLTTTLFMGEASKNHYLKTLVDYGEDDWHSSWLLKCHNQSPSLWLLPFFGWLNEFNIAIKPIWKDCRSFLPNWWPVAQIANDTKRHPVYARWIRFRQGIISVKEPRQTDIVGNCRYRLSIHAVAYAAH